MKNEPMVERLYRQAFWLGVFTILYNLAEGGVSLFFGVRDETLVLFGFGSDSFIECLSGLGVVAMVLRIRQNPDAPRGRFERTALRITGVSFFLLAAVLLATAIGNAIAGHQPETTIPGVVIALVSIAIMWLLVIQKRRVGKGLGSAAILADANCTLVCIYMSIVLLASSALYHFIGVGWVDGLGALGLAFFSWREGREAFAEAREVDGCRCSSGH